MASDASLVRGHLLLQLITRLFRTRHVAGKTVLVLKGFMHTHHLRVLAVTHGAAESRCREAHGECH